MPRQGRIHISGGVYHVIARGIERKAIFKDSKDRIEFLGRLSSGLKKTGTHCHAWALLANHLHLLLIPAYNPLSQLMQSLLTGYTLYFNRRHKRVGHLFQNRFKSILCQEDNYYLQLIRYIHLNPVKAGVVDDLEKLESYPWTGHAALLGKTKRDWQTTAEVLRRFGEDERTARREYLKFLQESKGLDADRDLEGGGLIRSAGGWEGLRELKKARHFWNKDERILGDGDFVAEVLGKSKNQLKPPEVLRRKGWSLDKLAARMCVWFGVEKEAIRKKWRVHKAKKARALTAYFGKTELGFSTKDLALYLSVRSSGITYLVKRGEEIKNQVDINWLF